MTLSDEETKLRVLRFAGIFGPNASGKSNIVYAFEALNKLINESRKYSYQDPIDAYDPFLLDKECALKPTTFVLKFLCRRSVYKYKVSFDKRTILDEVLSKLNGFVSNFQMALNPQIIKNYASGERESMDKLVFRGAKMSYLLLLTL